MVSNNINYKKNNFFYNISILFLLIINKNNRIFRRIKKNLKI
jgi:hypothetical protein